MKKIISTLALGALILGIMPLAAAQESERTEETGFLESLANLSGLENYQTTESVQGTIQVNEYGEDFTVNFVVDTNNVVDDLNGYSRIKANLDISNNKEADNFGTPFETLKLSAEGEMNTTAEDLYLKLNAFEVSAEGIADDYFELELETMNVAAQAFTGTWYQIPLNELNTGMPPMFDVMQLKTSFETNSEEAIRDFVEEYALGQIKQMLYYEDLYGNYVDVFEAEDYQALIEENEYEVHPVKVEALMEKGIFECLDHEEELLILSSIEEAEMEKEMIEMEGEMMTPVEMEEVMPVEIEEDIMLPPMYILTFENTPSKEGFQYVDCWVKENYPNEDLSDEEKEQVEMIDGHLGDWLYESENGWSYVVTRPEAKDEPHYGDNYLNYVEDALEVDLEGEIEKGFLECHDPVKELKEMEEMGKFMSEEDLAMYQKEIEEYIPGYLREDLSNGFRWPDCWIAMGYEGELTEVEEQLKEAEYNGEWIYLDGQWLFASDVYDYYDYEGEMAAIAAYEPDPEVLEEHMSKVRKGLDIFFDTKLFNQKEIVRGDYQGGTVFSLNRNNTAQMIQEIAALGGVSDESVATEVKEFLSMFSLSGLYELNEDSKALDHLYAKFKAEFTNDFNAEDSVEVEIDYALKTEKLTEPIHLQAPKEAETLEDVIDALMYL